MEKRVIKVKSVAKETGNTRLNQIKDKAALVAYLYPQYTYDEALDLDMKLVERLLRIAKQKQAELYLNLTQIAAAPHTKNGSGVTKLIKTYERLTK